MSRAAALLIDRVPARWLRPDAAPVFPLRSRPFLLLVVLVLIACAPSARSAGPNVKVGAARVWPAADYTRVTFESESAIQHKVFTLDNPERLVLDLEDVEMTSVLTALADKVAATDPYVKSVRVGRFKPGTVRLVFDLKATVKPQIFTLAPIGEYRHRLVLDLYPLVPPDPLLAFLDRYQAQREGAPEITGRPESPLGRMDTELGTVPAPSGMTPGAQRKGRLASARLITIAVDAGHGGEDPGARGRGGTEEKRRDARHCAKAERAHRPRAQHARGAGARRRLLHPLAHARAEGAARERGPLRVDPRRCLHQAPRARLVGVRAVGARRDLGCGTLARQARERCRLDRRRESRRARPLSQADAARSLADRDDQRQPEARQSGARRARGRSIRCTRARSNRPVLRS